MRYEVGGMVLTVDLYLFHNFLSYWLWQWGSKLNSAMLGTMLCFSPFTLSRDGWRLCIAILILKMANYLWKDTGLFPVGGFWNLWNHQEIFYLEGWQSAPLPGERVCYHICQNRKHNYPLNTNMCLAASRKLIRVDLSYYPHFPNEKDYQVLTPQDF